MIDQRDLTYLTERFHLLRIKHFSPKEILKGWDVPDEFLSNILPTVAILDQVREYFGIPFYPDSTYRSESYNKAVKGKPKSLHLVFNAIDFTIEDHRKLKMIFRFLCDLDSTPQKYPAISHYNLLPKPKGNFGLGLYPTFIHLDTRSTLGRRSPARW